MVASAGIAGGGDLVHRVQVRPLVHVAGIGGLRGQMGNGQG